MGAAALYYLFFMGGMDQVAGMINSGMSRLGVGGGSGGGGGSKGLDDLVAEATSGKEGKWTDEDGNNFNVEKDSRSQSNVQGNASASKISGDVEAMLRKMGVNGSRQNISRTRQVDTTGKAKQTQTKSQKSNHVFYQSNFGRMSLR